MFEYEPLISNTREKPNEFPANFRMTTILGFSYFIYGMQHIGMPYFLHAMKPELETFDYVWIFFFRSVANLFGQIFASRFHNEYGEWKYKVYGVVLIVGAGLCACLPFVDVLNVLIAVIAGMGFVEGWVNTGANMMVLHHWGTGVEPYMKGLHGLYGVGAIIICGMVGETVDREWWVIDFPVWSIAFCFFLCGLIVLIMKAPMSTLIVYPNATPLVSKRKKNHSVRVFICTVLLFLTAGVEELLIIWLYSWFRQMNSVSTNDTKSIFYLGSFFWTVYLFSRTFMLKTIRVISPVFTIVASFSAGIVLLFALIFLQRLWLYTWLGILFLASLHSVLFPAILSLPSHYDTWIDTTDSIIFFIGNNLGECVIPMIGGFAFINDSAGGTGMALTIIICYGIGLTLLLLISSLLRDFPNCDCCTDEDPFDSNFKQD